MQLPQQPNFRLLATDKPVTGTELRTALQWMWQELVKVINGNALLVDGELVDPNLSSTVPAAPVGEVNVIWQRDTDGNISAHTPSAPGGPPSGPAAGDLAGTYPNPTLNPDVVSAFAKTFLDDTTAAAVRATIGAGTSSVALPITEADVTGLVIDLAGKASLSHVHAEADVTSLVADLAAKVAANGAITGATKTKVTYDTKGLVTAGADATTADIADSTNKRYVTDAHLTLLGNTSGTNTGDQTLTEALIQEQILVSDDPSVTFSSIPATYRHLKLIANGRLTETATHNFLLLRVNGDSGANYDIDRARFIGTTTDFAIVFAQTSARCGTWPAASSGRSTQSGSLEISIPYYANTTFEKQILSRTGEAFGTVGNTMESGIYTIGWRSTAAISSITLLPSANNFLTGSIFSLYGVH